MKVTRDVVTDLLPVYFQDEASLDTRRLVDAFFKQDPAFARWAQTEATDLFESEAPDLFDSVETSLDEEMEALLRTKRHLRRRAIYLAMAIWLTLVPFTVVGVGTEMVWVFLDQPRLALAMLLGAAAFWGAWLRTRTLARTIFPARPNRETGA